VVVGFATEIGGVLLILEVASRISVIGLRGEGFPAPLSGYSPLPGYELNLQFIAGLIAILIAGPGLYSFDRRRTQSA